MTNAFRDLSSVNYGKCFSDSSVTGQPFIFEPTAQAASTYGILLSWDRDAEIRYFENFRAQLLSNSIPSLILNFTFESVGSDSAQFEANYLLTIPHTKPGVVQSFQGRAQFSLVKDNTQNWAIRRWVDLANQTDDVTWSHLKGVFAQ